MRPTAAGIGRVVASGSVGLAVAVVLALGTLLGHFSTRATAQSAPPDSDPAYFPATGYRVSEPRIQSYFQHRGGARTFGYPVSSDFPLLGRRVQIFQREVLELRPDGSVAPLDLLAPGYLPVTHADGLILPAADPALLAAAPAIDSPDYLAQALAFVGQVVPDDWNGLPVNFGRTYQATVTCGDAFGDDPAACDPSLLPAFALEVWGLPTSQPTVDPDNNDFVYQRFQRGVMHFSRSTGLTQGLLLGDWFKRVLVGSNLSPDLRADAQGSRFLAQFAPDRPLGLARPDLLPDTSLASAFRADSLSIAQATSQITLPPSVAETATAIAATATITGGTAIALQATQVSLTSTALAATITVVAGSPTTAVATPTGTPVVVTGAQSAAAGTPVSAAGCLGDEQMFFTPRKPYLNTHVDISVTSQRRHDARYMRLTGPLDAGPVVERPGLVGWIWTWTVLPSTPDFYNWTFYADGLHPCITSGFNATLPLGATATATPSPNPTSPPGPTNTPTPTPTPGVPTITAVSNNSSGGCGDLVIINGNNFGSPPSANGTQVYLTGGTGVGGGTKLLTLLSGSNTTLTTSLPSTGLSPGSRTLLVTTSQGAASAPFTVNPPAC